LEGGEEFVAEDFAGNVEVRLHLFDSWIQWVVLWAELAIEHIASFAR